MAKAGRFDYTHTAVYYEPGGRGIGVRLARQLGVVTSPLPGGTNPRRLVVYQEARHAIGACPSVNLGPHPPTMVADWMAARFAGKPMSNERWYVDNSGAVTRTAL